MDVHMFSGSAFAWRVLLALEIKGVAYREISVQASPAGLKSPEFLALNPRGKAPVIREGGYALAESAAMLAYLDRKYPEPSSSAARPRTPAGSGARSSISISMWRPPGLEEARRGGLGQLGA